jgi:hypothetical protein
MERLTLRGGGVGEALALNVEADLGARQAAVLGSGSSCPSRRWFVGATLVQG